MTKLAEINITDMSNDAIHKAICNEFGENFMRLNDIDHAIEHGTIEVCSDKIVIWG